MNSGTVDSLLHTKYFRVSEKVYRLTRHLGIIPATLGRIQGGFMTVEERLRLAQIEAERLRRALEKAKKDKRKAAAERPQFPGSHRGY